MKINGSLPYLLLAGLVALGGYYYYAKKEATQPKTIFTFMGAPGSGKGTLADKAIQNLGFTSISTGNLLREAVAKGDKFGKQVQNYMKQGALVPDEIITSIMEKWLNSNLATIDNLILDGYPRTAKQAEMFIELMRKRFPNVLVRVIEITVPDDVIIKRLGDRLVCEKCQTPYAHRLLKDPTKLVCENCGGKLILREDDKPETVRKRLKVYADTANPMRDAYKAARLQVHQITGEDKNPTQLFEAFELLIGKPRNNSKTASKDTNAVAQLNLGMMYWEGKGAPQDFQKAKECFDAVIAQNENPDLNTAAQLILGLMYQEGQGVPQDFQKAKECFDTVITLNANQKSIAAAQLNLGLMYQEGLGVAQDDKKAKEYFDAAAQLSA